MKKLYFLLFLALPSLADAQYAKYGLVEWFTNTYCPICASRNPPARAVFDQYKDKLHRITIHPSVPYSQCPLYSFNREDNGARQSYYGIGGTPTIYLNGNGTSTTPAAFEASIQGELALTSPISIQVDEITASRTATITISSSGDIPDGNYRIFVAILESSVDLVADNGEKDHFDVLRAFASSKDGDEVALPAKGEETVVTYQYTVPNGVDADKAYLLIFIQDIDTRAVLNSGTKFDGVSTSVANLAQESSLSAFPNPARDLLKVSVGEGFRIHGVEIINQLGQHIRSLSMDSPERLSEINVHDLPAGNYLLKVNLGKEEATMRFIKE